MEPAVMTNQDLIERLRRHAAYISLYEQVAPVPVNGALHTAIREAIAALESRPAGVAVKKLEWTAYGKAVTLIGCYELSFTVTLIARLDFDGKQIGLFENDDLAKAFAQADFDQRIRSAMEPSPEIEARAELGCFDCGRPYDKGPDLVVSDEDWKRIEREPCVLCPNCMHDRFVAIGAPDASVPAKFTSGPFAEAPADEFAWLIERQDSEPSAPRYWSAEAGAFDTWASAWTPDHLIAIRFARREDAEQVARGVLGGIPTRVCEHGWHATASPGERIVAFLEAEKAHWDRAAVPAPSLVPVLRKARAAMVPFAYAGEHVAFYVPEALPSEDDMCFPRRGTKVWPNEGPIPFSLAPRHFSDAREALAEIDAALTGQPETGDGWSCSECGQGAPERFRVFARCHICAANQSIRKRDATIAQLRSAIRSRSDDATEGRGDGK